MSSNIVPRPDSAASPQRLDRRTRREVMRLGQQAYVDGARLISRAYVAQVAMANVDLVTREEAHYIAAHPMMEHRFRAIGDGFAVYAARQSAGMGF